jgi:hypothetical protein
MKKLLTLIFALSLAPYMTMAASSTVFQLTDTPYQETHAFIDKNLVVYSAFTGAGDHWIDVWGYDLRTHQNFPIIERVGQQWVSGFHENKIVYEQFNDATQRYSIRMYNLKTKKDIGISSDENKTYSSGVTNGREVVYIEGGACGKLWVYPLHHGNDMQLADHACIPRISGHRVFWVGSDPDGSGLHGYDLTSHQHFAVWVGQGAVDTFNVSDDKVIWMQPAASHYKILLKDLRRGTVRTLLDTTDYYVNYPSVSRRFAVWGKSLSPGTAGVEGIDLKTGQIFEVFPQGPHQNTNLATEMYRNTAIWQAWRTGNGDIYGATLKK